MIKLQCVIYQWIRLKALFKIMESFSNFEFVSEFLAEKWKFSKEYPGVNMIKLQCVIYLWICLNELYKLMESFFFQISDSFLELVTIFKNNSGIVFMRVWGGICAEQHAF